MSDGAAERLRALCKSLAAAIDGVGDGFEGDSLLVAEAAMEQARYEINLYAAQDSAVWDPNSDDAGLVRPVVPENMQYCTGCGHLLFLSEKNFHHDYHLKNGWKRRCVECSSKRKDKSILKRVQDGEKAAKKPKKKKAKKKEAKKKKAKNWQKKAAIVTKALPASFDNLAGLAEHASAKLPPANGHEMSGSEPVIVAPIAAIAPSANAMGASAVLNNPVKLPEATNEKPPVSPRGSEKKDNKKRKVVSKIIVSQRVKTEQEALLQWIRESARYLEFVPILGDGACIFNCIFAWLQRAGLQINLMTFGSVEEFIRAVAVQCVALSTEQSTESDEFFTVYRSIFNRRSAAAFWTRIVKQPDLIRTNWRNERINMWMIGCQRVLPPLVQIKIFSLSLENRAWKMNQHL